MVVNDARNFHLEYQPVTTQHWNEKSEVFAGGDHLMTAIASGWDIEKCLEIRHDFAVARSVTVFQFTLVKDDSIQKMPVISNPYIQRFIRDAGIVAEKMKTSDDEEAA